MNTLKQILMSNNPVTVLRSMVEDGSLKDLDPMIAGLKMDIPKGFHHKDNLEHSIRVLGNAISRETNGPDLILRTAALLHDIGKPATRKFGTRKSVTFDGHERVGATIARKMLKNHGYSKAEIQDITLLIALHMRSHGFRDVDWTDSAVRRLITDVGDDTLMEKLIIIFYADSTTKNAQKLKIHRAGIEALRKEIARVKKADERKALRPALNGHEVMEIFNLTPGRELGKIMKFLNSDEGISLTRDEALEVINEKFV